MTNRRGGGPPVEREEEGAHVDTFGWSAPSGKGSRPRRSVHMSPSRTRMPPLPRSFRSPLLTLTLWPAIAFAQGTTVPLTPEAWVPTDSVKAVPFLGRPALYMKKGVALIRDAAMENGTYELDVAATDST